MIEEDLIDPIPVDYINIDELEKLFPGLVIKQSITRSACDEDEECDVGCCEEINQYADLNGDGVISVLDLSFAGPWFAAGGAGSWDGVNYTVQPGDPMWMLNFSAMSHIISEEGGGVVTIYDFLIIARYILGCYEC